MSEPVVQGEAAPEPDAVLEAYGQSCVMLEPLIKRHMRPLATGQVLEVLCDDPTARLGIPAWCRLSGNPLVGMVRDEPPRMRFYIRRK